MKKWKQLYGFMLLEGTVLFLLQLFWWGDEAVVLYLPYVPLGKFLRTLSLEGGTWNVAAWILYVIFCALPALPCFIRILRKSSVGMRWFGCIFSMILFPCLYGLINPHWIRTWLGGTYTGQMGSLMICMLLHSVLAFWLVLSVIHYIRKSSNMTGCLVVVLAAINILLVAVLCADLPAGLAAELRLLETENTALTSAQLLPTRVVLYLGTCIQALPFLLDIWVIHILVSLLDEMQKDPYGWKTVSVSQKLGRAAVTAVVLQMAAQTAFHLLQVMFSPCLHRIQISICFPLFSIALGIGALLLSGWLQKGNVLRRENEEFI